MPLSPNDVLELDVDKPAAGGRMLARQDGQVVLVLGAIPGERVRARVEQVRGGVVYATTTAVERASVDRREPEGDPLCGGTVYAHVAYERQLSLKGEIIADALARIGRLPLAQAPAVAGSPESGYRMRARLHGRGTQVGFFREGTHDLCPAGATRQLLPGTVAAVEALALRLGAAGVSGTYSVELHENVAASERALFVEVAEAARRRIDAARVVENVAVLEVTGLAIGRADSQRPTASVGSPYVSDHLRIDVRGRPIDVTLRRHVRSFFQGNRHLLGHLIRRVTEHVPDGPVLDLYAGCGLFGLALAAAGVDSVTAVEGDRRAADDLRVNAEPFQTSRVLTMPVETYLDSVPAVEGTVIVDPPRTGLSREVSAAIGASGAARIVYVSCDSATLARDARKLVDAGYGLVHIEGLDLFPGTAHVETVAVFDPNPRSAGTHPGIIED
jgi:23S rRNA (uracil1939-C5)-methyltransferase